MQLCDFSPFYYISLLCSPSFPGINYEKKLHSQKRIYFENTSAGINCFVMMQPSIFSAMSIKTFCLTLTKQFLNDCCFFLFLHWNTDSPKISKMVKSIDLSRCSNSYFSVMTGLIVSINVAMESF